MSIANDKTRYLQTAECLSSRLQKPVTACTQQVSQLAQEIRLRLNRPLAIYCPNATYFVTDRGELCTSADKNALLCVTKSDITETFSKICNYSVYNRQNEIINGYITMRGGHRAGISGTAVINDGKMTNIRDVSSINIRISREHPGCARQLDQRLGRPSGGVLICGAPCSGKTTVLRDYARLLSQDGAMRVSLVDERGELAGTAGGVFQNDIGLCDVYDGYNKAVAMLQAIRSMSPDVIVCDEIGSDDDIKAIERAVNSGAAIVATVHASDQAELMRKPNIMRLLAQKVFESLVFLSSRSRPGEIVKIISSGEALGR